MAHFVNPNAKMIYPSVIAESDAPSAAENALNSYGGLPQDAELFSVVTEYAQQLDRKTGQLVNKYPSSTRVQYLRKLDNYPVVGSGGYIDIALGENGELISLRKVWRTVTPSGTVKIISATDAIGKMNQKDVMNPLREWYDLNVTSIQFGYYEKGLNETQEYIEPVWIMKGFTDSGEPVSYYIYARQFSNFTATPTSGKVPLNVTFTDTSDASPIRWLWNFGDGTNSTEQNPVHTYTTAGTYNVSLRAWNDLGSDTMEKTGYITVRLPAPPVANFTASPLTGGKPLKVSFNDTSTNMPERWLWTFGDGTNATVQNPVHTYTQAGNYTVSLNVTNSDGADSLVRTGYITVTRHPVTTPPTTKPTTAVTTKPTPTKPTPTKTHAPLSPVIVMAGIAGAGVLWVFGKNRTL